MSNNFSLQIGEWYWLTLKGFDVNGRPFGQILELITPKIVKIRVGVFYNQPTSEIINPEMIINVKYIGEKVTAEEGVNIFPELI